MVNDAPVVVAVVQLALAVGEADANRKAAAAAVAEAAAAGARVVVLPELSDSGYVFGTTARTARAEARDLAAPATGNPTLGLWRDLAAAHRLVIVGGFCELGTDGMLYNSAAVVDASGTLALYRKAHLWDSEKLVFTAGDAAPPVVDLGFGRVAVMVCYDLEFPEWARLAALDGADLIAAPVNWPAPASVPHTERAAEVIKAQAAAASNGVFVAVADRCQAERGVSWIGGALIAGPDGYPLAGPVLADRPAVLTAACDLPRARDKAVASRNDLLADRRPGLYSRLAAHHGDRRVAAANAHWSARFIANGTDYADVQATLTRITRWDDWCREWGRTAQHYERAAETAEAAGTPVTAGQAWRRAALCWHWGKFVFVDHPGEQRAAHERTVACFRRGAGTLSPPAEPVRVPYRDTTLAAYLRVPHGGTPPVVIMIPGLDSVKEELQAAAEYLLARGLAVIAVDGPGQGEAEYDLPIEPAYERVTAAVADYLETRGDVDATAIGAFGVSLGGYYAARSAAFEPRLRAAVTLSGPYRWDLDWDALPPQTRATFQRRSEAASAAEARALAGTLTLEGAAAAITTPLLVAAGGRDRLVPPYHAERLAREAHGAELMLIPDGSHGLTSHAFESRSAMADWLAARLRL
ncbi:MAG: alpha/beta hydrolase [Streptosporangiaceae bacterium]|nr:alpha/beta hydrolase [Streptosporangiaceae bacterium]